MISKLKHIFRIFVKNIIVEMFSDLFQKHFERKENDIEDLISEYFRNYFNEYFSEELNKVIYEKIDTHLHDIFTSQFDDEFSKRISEFKIQDEELKKIIIKTETKLKKGNGETKLDYACDLYLKAHKEDILNFTKDLIKNRLQTVFEEKKDFYNQLVMSEPKCL